jgi:hypothetical protein
MQLDKFIPKGLQDDIEKVVAGLEFPWYYRPSTLYVGKNTSSGSPKDFQFTHNFFQEDERNSEYFEVVKPIMYFVEHNFGTQIKNLLRVKANLLTNSVLTETELEQQVHIDHSSDNFYSLIYYVIDSDGDTVIYDPEKGETRVPPVKGNCVIFPSTTKHRATSPVLNKRRIVLNFIFEI